MDKTSEALFLQGNFKKILSFFEIYSKQKPDPFTIGALVFTGRTDDAEVYLQKWIKEYSADEQLLISFFLAVGFVRSSNFERGRVYLGKCFSLRHHLQEKHSKAFLFQGFGFYSHFVCRYKKSAYWAQKAWKQSLLTDSDFGQILSSDLLAHALIEKGEINKGFEQLEKATKIAVRFGQGALVTSLEVSKLCYQASRGLKPQTIVSSLQKKFSEMGVAKDTYSKTNLGLELTRQYILRGKASKAISILETIQAEVFKFGHRRQRSNWYFRFAFIEYLRGERSSALKHLQSALDQIQNEDLAHRLQALGLQYQIDNDPILLPQIQKISLRVGSQMAMKHYNRLTNEIKPLSEDTLGDLIDEIKIRKNSTFETTQRICELGYFQLLRNYLIRPRKKHLFMDVLPQSLLVFSEGNVDYYPDTVTPLIQRTLLLLKTGPKTKQQIIESLWGYQYDSLRHDQLVHAALTRLRKSMGPASGWIKNEEEAFILDSEVGVGVFEHSKVINQKEDNVSENNLKLNYRQIKILSALRKAEVLSVRECMQILKTTKITVNRDLNALLCCGLIRKSGNGKSTRYH